MNELLQNTKNSPEYRDILNIKEAAQRAKEQGMHISEYTIRRVIRSGEVPCRIVGRTYLISWKNLVDWAMCVNSCDKFKN